MSDFDVIVVGTRCAGASLAMLLAREGYRVLNIDRAHFPSDTLSTHFLWPGTTHFLEAWSLLDRLAATGCPRIDTVTPREASADIREHAAVRHLLWDGQRVSARSPALACDAASVPGLSAKSLGCRDPAHCTGGGAFGHTGALPGCAPAARRNLPMRRLWRRCACTERRDHEPECRRDRFTFGARRAYRLGDRRQRAPVPE
jgi:hypothetical protein